MYSDYFSEQVRDIQLRDFFSTHPETILHLWDVLFCFQGSIAPHALHQFLDMNRWKAEVRLIGLKVDLWVSVFGP